MRNTIVTMLRDPINRIISAFLFDVMIPTGFSLKTLKLRDQMKQIIRQADVPIVAYAALPGIASCQTKMILGYNCGENRQLTDHDLKSRCH